MKPKPIGLLLLLLSFFSAYGQTNFRVMFYNVENLFDTLDNPEKNDNEFLPDGARHWTVGRYNNKINNIAKVITSAGEWDDPALLGMCEVENDKTLKDLTQYSPLRKADYRYVITESPDIRGINVALLYRRDKFKYLTHKAYTIRFPYNARKKTRDILHVTGLVASMDTLDVFVCHFPSRRGGEKESENDRKYVASILKSKTDSLLKIRKNAYLVIMGDFNDEPSNISVSNTLNAKPITQNINPTGLYNLFLPFEKRNNTGSYKYGKQWNMLDQIIVSGNLIEGSQSIRVQPSTATIFRRDFMLTEDKTHGGKRLKKTFHGYHHEGGYSDHLPVYVDFTITAF
ncbi:MAG: endonuclease [Candidatus Symbiothrix sp.]|jgi:predicted extracellular nuclease|nr:endonuclease [Candidatus Symbiothrix sp.]